MQIYQVSWTDGGGIRTRGQTSTQYNSACAVWHSSDQPQTDGRAIPGVGPRSKMPVRNSPRGKDMPYHETLAERVCALFQGEPTYTGKRCSAESASWLAGRWPSASPAAILRLLSHRRSSRNQTLRDNSGQCPPLLRRLHQRPKAEIQCPN